MQAQRLQQLTDELASAAQSGDLDQARRILAARQDWIERSGPSAAPELGPILERGRAVISDLERHRDGLSADIARLKQARGRISSFHPARNSRRRLDLEM